MQAGILRPSYFAEIWLSAAIGFDARNATARIYGSGDAKVSYISALASHTSAKAHEVR